MHEHVGAFNSVRTWMYLTFKWLVGDPSPPGEMRDPVVTETNNQVAMHSSTAIISARLRIRLITLDEENTQSKRVIKRNENSSRACEAEFLKIE